MEVNMMEVNVEQTFMEVTTSEDSANNHNQNILDCKAVSSMQRENQNWQASCAKSMKLDLDTKSIGTDSHYNDITDEETICLDNKDTLHNGLCKEEAEHNDDLRQFDVLDDLDRHPEQNDDSDDDSDTDESMDSDVPDEEIEAMLEEGIL